MSTTKLSRSHVHGHECYTIENSQLRVSLLPSLGGKMIELRDLSNGRDWLLPSQRQSQAYPMPAYGDVFEAYDTSGFDECFPTIEASNGFPDHGELWSRPWNCAEGEDELVLSIAGVKAGYRFQKRVRLLENKVTLSYRVTNDDTGQFYFIWSAHPLLSVTPGMKLLLPESLSRVMMNWASQDDLGRLGDEKHWPDFLMNNSLLDFSVVQNVGAAVKCFSDPLEEGFAGVYDPARQQGIMLEFNPVVTPYLGLWLCYGGWPATAAKKHLTVGLEPCNGRPDALQSAITREECGVLKPGASKEWEIALSVVSGTPSEIISRVRSSQSTPVLQS